MKAAVYHAPNQPLTIEDVEIDNPGPREVLIRTAAAGLCHSDLHFMEGKWPWPAPAVLGHESAGVVEAVGRDVTYVKPGDHVITCLSVFCGHCEFCLTGHMSICQTPEVKMPPGAARRLRWKGQHLNQYLNLSSFAEQMLVHEHALVKITPEMPLDVAALIGCGVMTGYGAIIHTAKVEPGSTVAIAGCGGIGLAAVNGAAIAGAGRIIAIDKDPGKLELARKMGATDGVIADDDSVKRINEMTGGGVHYSFECVGLKQTAELCFSILRPGGTATIIGMIPMGVKLELHGPDFLRERRIQGSSMGSNRFRVDMPRMIEFYQQGRLHLDQLISNRISLSEINEGFEAMKKGGVARSVIVF
ncbi:MAG: Zn-dependent alcohol dehydrogenase [Burkholderiaceae bacterium]|nr:MAG: Zn-dependent alcohol dehydrogenase [Burkholderiaceae bacterium]